jgi:membrane protease YdiL (CAAX protease family)
MRTYWQALKFDKRDIHIYWLLISAPILLTLYRYYGYPEAFFRFFGDSGNSEIYARFWQFGIFFMLMMVIPLLSTRYFKELDLSAMGLGLGDYKTGLKLVIVAIPFIVLPIIYFAADMPELRSEYPLAKILLQDHSWILTYELSYICFYYIAWEFFFRGFLLFGLLPKFGAMNAVLIQTISSCLIHIGKPEGEIIGSILVGIMFGAIALRTRSIWYVFLIHAAIGIMTDLFIIFK